MREPCPLCFIRRVRCIAFLALARVLPNESITAAFHGRGRALPSTLAISPEKSGRGYGKAFVAFYEEWAVKHGLTELRMDTNAINTTARAMYQKLGYKEISVVPTTFNGIPGVDLVLLEKHLNGCWLCR